MNVVILMPLAEQRGGAEQLLRTFLAHARQASINWTVLFFEDGPIRAEVEALGIDTVVVETGRLRNPLRYLRAVREIVTILRQHRADLAFSWMSKAHLYGSAAAWQVGIPALWYQHDIPATPGLLDRLITLMPARQVVTCSQAAAEAQRSLWPSRPAVPVPPCVDLDRFDPDRLPPPTELRRSLGLPANGPLVGIVGRLQHWKGIHVFVRAMRRVVDAWPTAYGVIVGGRHELEPEYEAFIRAQIDAQDLTGHILLAGFQDNVPEWMQAMDVVVHASDREPFGMVVIEALALEKPVVAGAEGGPSEIITDGHDGLLAPFGDDERLATQVLRYLEHPEFAHRVAAAGRKRARAFAADAYASRLIETVKAQLPAPARDQLSFTP